MITKEMLDEAIKRGLAVANSYDDVDKAADEAREYLIREVAERWWEQVYRSGIPWLDRVIDRDALAARIADEVSSSGIYGKVESAVADKYLDAVEGELGMMLGVRIIITQDDDEEV